MPRQKHEVADIIRSFIGEFVAQHLPNSYHLRILNALSKCRTSALGGHVAQCDYCGKRIISYNSCRNRHCPKCQGSNQAIWVEDRINMLWDTKHFHIVFTVPEVLNEICLADSKWFYNHLFACTWDTLKSFGYTHYAVESGAIAVLHTWGQNLSLHPHIHAIVPAAGQTLSGNLKHIGENGKYLYPVKMLSSTFRGKFLQGIKKHFAKKGTLPKYQAVIDVAYNKDWVVFCEPSFGKPKHVIGYLGLYINRVAISNHRIRNVIGRKVTFSLTDYRDQAKSKTITLDAVEFLRRFCLHILPYRFVKIRYYGVYSTRFRTTMQRQYPKMVIKIPETTAERLKRLTGFDVLLCPNCRKGRLILMVKLPPIRAPDHFRCRRLKKENN